jgi:hypothetical protein
MPKIVQPKKIVNSTSLILTDTNRDFFQSFILSSSDAITRLLANLDNYSVEGSEKQNHITVDAFAVLRSN